MYNTVNPLMYGFSSIEDSSIIIAYVRMYNEVLQIVIDICNYIHIVECNKENCQHAHIGLDAK